MSPTVESIKIILDVLTDQPQTFKMIHDQVAKDKSTIRRSLNALTMLGLAEKVGLPRSMWKCNIHHESIGWIAKRFDPHKVSIYKEG
jgi:hypothetical protein